MGFVGFTLSYVLFAVLHSGLFALSITVCGLYGKDLKRAQDSDVDADSKWIYAVVVGALSALSAAIYLVPFVLRVGGFFVAVWDFILFVLWIALFGVFGKMYITEDPEGDSDIQRMKNAVWVDLAAALLWLITALAAVGYWAKHRETRTRFTGRAKV